MTYLDDDGQPFNLAFNAQRRIDAGIDEVLGFIRGVLADNEVSHGEVIQLAAFMASHPDIANDWPANVLIARLNRIFEDGDIDDDERTDLKTLLDEIIGVPEDNPWAIPASALPLTKPAPEIVFDGNIFVFTGKFAFGPRRICQSETCVRGGLCEDSVTLRTNYVVIGAMGSRDWIHSSWGRKVQKAVEYAGYNGLAIISERTWTKYLLPDHPAQTRAANAVR